MLQNVIKKKKKKIYEFLCKSGIFRQNPAVAKESKHNLELE
jgi:hypothetical protein